MATILILDDNAELLEAMRLLLAKHGHRVVTDKDGCHLEKLMHETEFDVLITDLIMPEKEGIEVILGAKRIKKGIKIIAMSGGGSIDARLYLDMAACLGADQVLLKPFQSNLLLSTINNLVEQSPDYA